MISQEEIGITDEYLLNMPKQLGFLINIWQTIQTKMFLQQEELKC